MKRTSLLFLITICLLTGIFISPPQAHASTLGFFDPSYTYLDQGNSNMTDNGDQTATISVSTTAKQEVESIGINIYLERWTGSKWVQVSTKVVSESNELYSSGYATFNIISGYYYRARTVHWINNNGVYEQGEYISNTILAE